MSGGYQLPGSITRVRRNSHWTNIVEHRRLLAELMLKDPGNARHTTTDAMLDFFLDSHSKSVQKRLIS
jgi:hypothetical protein